MQYKAYELSRHAEDGSEIPGDLSILEAIRETLADRRKVHGAEFAPKSTPSGPAVAIQQNITAAPNHPDNLPTEILARLLGVDPALLPPPTKAETPCDGQSDPILAAPSDPTPAAPTTEPSAKPAVKHI